MIKNQEIAINFLIKLLEELGVDGDVKSVQAENGREYIVINTVDDNILIGYHGQTLDAIQHITNIMIHKTDENLESVVVDIGGYRVTREEKIIEAAKKAAEKSKFMEKPVGLFPMSAYERKLVHDQVSLIEGVTSASQGEGIERRVIIYPERLGS